MSCIWQTHMQCLLDTRPYRGLNPTAPRLWSCGNSIHCCTKRQQQQLLNDGNLDHTSTELLNINICFSLFRIVNFTPVGHPRLLLTDRPTSRPHWRRGRRKGRGLLHRDQYVWQQQVWQVWVGGVSCWFCSGTWGPLILQLVYHNSQSWKVQSLEVEIPRCWSRWSEGLTWRYKLSYSVFQPPAKRQRLT